MNSFFRIGVAVTTLAWCLSARAAPSRFELERFSELISQATDVLIEGFDYSPHGGANPYNIANGTLRSISSVRGGSLPSVGPAICAVDGRAFESNTLTVADPASTSIFSDFPEGTTLWAARVCFLNPEDTIEITVAGASGEVTMTVEAQSIQSFLAFQDAAGLASISIRNLGPEGAAPSSYYFDEITTARAR